MFSHLTTGAPKTHRLPGGGGYVTFTVPAMPGWRTQT